MALNQVIWERSHPTIFAKTSWLLELSACTEVLVASKESNADVNQSQRKE